MSRTLAGFILAAPLIALTACAAGPGGRPAGPGGRPEGPPPSANLFVSPFGELFIAEPGQAYPVSAWFAGADVNHDGSLDWTEFQNDGLRWFAQLDLDHDGQIGPSEIAAYEQSAGELAGRMGRGDRGGGPSGGPSGGPGGGDRGGPGGDRGGPPPRMNVTESSAQDMPPMSGNRGRPPGGGRRGGRGVSASDYPLARAGLLAVPQPVKAADTDVNSRITAEEWARATQRWWGLLDKDRDGRLTLAELPRTANQQAIDGPPRRR